MVDELGLVLGTIIGVTDLIIIVCSLRTCKNYCI